MRRGTKKGRREGEKDRKREGEMERGRWCESYVINYALPLRTRNVYETSYLATP